MDSKSGKRPRIHPCICGFECEKYSLMKHHREACSQWQNRPNPMRIMIERRRATKIERLDDQASGPCSICLHRQDHHEATCPNSQSERVRRDLVDKHDIPRVPFRAILHQLAKRYRN